MLRYALPWGLLMFLPSVIVPWLINDSVEAWWRFVGLNAVIWTFGALAFGELTWRGSEWLYKKFELAVNPHIPM